jgi:hypothetical protein
LDFLSSIVEVPMSSYRCYFLDDKDSVGAEVNIRADDLTDAIDQALVRLEERPRFCAIELWAGETLAYCSPLTEAV